MLLETIGAVFGKRSIFSAISGLTRGFSDAAMGNLSKWYNASWIPGVGIYKAIRTIAQGANWSSGIKGARAGLMSSMKSSGVDVAENITNAQLYKKASKMIRSYGSSSGHFMNALPVSELNLFRQGLESRKLFGPYLQSNLAVIAMPTLVSSVATASFARWAGNRVRNKWRGYQDYPGGRF